MLRRIAIIGGILVAVFIFRFIPDSPHHSNYAFAQAVFELTCPSATTSVQALQTTDTITGKLRQNYCVDSSGNVFENITGATVRFNAEIYPSGLSGATCGDKINAAILLLPANGGVLKINQACGAGSGAVPWAAINSSLNYLILDIIEPGNYFSSGITLTGIGSAIRGLPCASSAAGNQCPVTITEGNNLNLPALITLSSTGFQSTREIAFDGNNANNPTGGVCVKVPNASPRISFDHVTTQNCTTHGRWFFSTGGTDSSCCAKDSNGMSLNNNGDAVLIQETSDIYLTATENESQGINPIVNTQNAATGGCAGNCVTWVSGPKWSTDVSLVGTATRINNAAAPFFISSIQSQTVLTLTSAPGTQNGVQFNNGNAIENRNGGAMRVIGGEASGSSTSRGMDGILATCGNGQSSGSLIIDGVALGNNVQNDIEFLGSDPAAPATICMFGNTVTGSKFSGGAIRTPDTTWSNVFVQDGGGHVIGPNYYTSNATPHSAKFAVQLTETASGRVTSPHSIVGGNTNTGYNAGAAGYFPYIDSNLNKSGFVVCTPGTIVSNLETCNSQNVIANPALQTSSTPGGALSQIFPAGVAANFNLQNVSGFLDVLIGNGTATMTTAAIAAGACGTTVTVASANVATTDTITWAFNSAPSGTNAGIVAWPTSGNVNFAYCPGVAETPAAATINWRVFR